MYVMRWFIMEPFVELHELQLQMDELTFGLLVLSTVLIAAGGYVINDYFDLKIDRINKPEKIVIGRFIKRRVAIVSHWIIQGLGLAIGIYVSVKVGLWQLCFIHIFSMLAMWFYSTDLKRQLISGNLVIAITVALVPLSVVLFEVPAMNFHYGPELKEIVDKYEKADQVLQLNIDGDMVDTNEDPRATYYRLITTLFYWILTFSVFAFLLSLAREITKDAADEKGDRQYGCKTIPIVWGFRRTKLLVNGLYILVATLLVIIQQQYLPDRFSFMYLVIFMVPLLALNIYLTIKANDRQGYSRASQMNKLISLIGICYAFIAFYQIGVLNG